MKVIIKLCFAKTTTDSLGERPCASDRPKTTDRREGGSRPGGAGLRRPADVAMVQAADFGKLHDLTYLRPLDWPHIRRIFWSAR